MAWRYLEGYRCFHPLLLDMKRKKWGLQKKAGARARIIRG